MPIDFTPTEEQRLLRARAREFARDVLSGVGPATRHLPAAEERHRATLPFYQQMVEVGFLRQLVPEELGGDGTGAVTVAILAEELIAGDPSAALSLFSTSLGLAPVLRGRTPEQPATPPHPVSQDAGRTGGVPGVQRTGRQCQLRLRRARYRAVYDHATPRPTLDHRRQQAAGVGCHGLGRNRADPDDRRVPRRGGALTGGVAGRRRRRGVDRGAADHRLIRSARPPGPAASAVRPRRRDGAGRQHHRRTRHRAHVDQCRVRGRRRRGVCRPGDARLSHSRWTSPAPTAAAGRCRSSTTRAWPSCSRTSRRASRRPGRWPGGPAWPRTCATRTPRSAASTPRFSAPRRRCSRSSI